jgi:N4-(beta-N-acetylglucosaminyl)-L-asparaginase
MFNRRHFLRSSLFSSLTFIPGRRLAAYKRYPGYPDFRSITTTGHPVVISTWDAGLAANKGAWEVLSRNGRALDAVEAGVRVTEDSLNCCVGLGANPDRDGYVTLDACIMDELGNCGSVGFLERIKHPISVARRVMEKTPHVMLVGVGAQEFAVEQGFPLEEQKLSGDARKAYELWLKDSNYKPVINIENTKAESGHPEGGHPGSGQPEGGHVAPADDQRAPFAPSRLENGEWNHDTIGMVAMDASGNLSGSCTTSGMGFKMRGRLGDSPIIGAGLFVDNEVGAVTATGQGEDVIRICGSHTVVELMRQGLSPEKACQAAVERIMRIKGPKAKEIQVAFLALNKKGESGSFAIQPGFSYALRSEKEEKMFESKSYY